MAKRFATPSINWNELAKRVPPEQRANFLVFKGKSDGYLRRVLSNPPEPPKINWEEYQKTVPIPGLVDKLKSAYESFKVPYPQDTLSSKVDEQWSSLQPEIKKFCDQQNITIAAATKEIERIRALPPYEEMTLEMYAEMFPEDALDSVNRPTFWPHDAEEQFGYVPPQPAEGAVKKAK